MAEQQEDPVAFVSGQPLGWAQIKIAMLAVLAAAIEGFDVQCLAFVMPLIGADWGLPNASFGVALAAAVVGGGVGMLTISPLADRFGRRRVFAVTFIGVGVFSLLTVATTSLPMLISCRFLVGLCMGGSLPAIMALASEYMPAKLRATIVTIGFCGMPLGAAFGGLAMSGAIESFGWRSVFVAGGFAPLVALPIFLWLLPESLSYLLSRPDGQARAVRVLAGFPRPPTSNLNWRVGDDTAVRFPVRAIVGERRLLGTLNIWALFILAVSVMYFFINWMPALLVMGGFGQREAVQATAMLNLGAVCGALGFARWIDKAGPALPISVGFALAAAALVTTALVGLTPLALFIGMTSVGVFLSGGQFGLNVLCVSFYPPAASATGLGWALAAGRVGAVVSSALGGVFIASGGSIASILVMAAAPLALCVFLMLGFAWGAKRRAVRALPPLSA